MAEACVLQCERKCQVWQLAVGRESSTSHMHMPCLPGGGQPGGGLVGRTYGGGCRSACSGSVRYPVQHYYPAGRMKKWFAETKEWFWDGMFVMRRENPTKSASHYCLPFPRPTMRLPRSRNSRLVEVHHVHPPPSSESELSNVQSNEEPLKEPVPTDPSESTGAAELQTPVSMQENGEALNLSGSSNINSRSADIPESREAIATDGFAMQNMRLEEQSTPSAKPDLHELRQDKVVRISHIEVTAKSPSTISPEKKKDEDHSSNEFTRIDYGSSSCCPKFLKRQRIFQKATVDSVSSTAVDVQELRNCYLFLADMPGLSHLDVKVQVEDDSIMKIIGNRRRDGCMVLEGGEIKYLLIERTQGKLVRKFTLPCNTYLDGISAACQDGLLTIIVPKCANSLAHLPRNFDVEVIPLAPQLNDASQNFTT